MPGIDIEERGTVTLLTLRNEEGMNSFDPAYLRDVGEAIRQVLASPARGLVLTGAGRAFSTGADVKAMQRAAARGEAAEWILEATEALHPTLLALQSTPTVSVAAVNGVAAGGGLGIALACDARVGSPQARFAAGYFGIGLCPDGGATWLLPRLIGIPRTRRFFFGNEVIGADEALSLGLLDALVPPERLVEESVAWATRWGSFASHSRWSTKRLLATALHQDMAGQMDMERGLIAAAGATADFAEGTTAFVEKREPRFA